MAIYLGNNLQSGAVDSFDLAVAQGYTGTKAEYWAIINNTGTLSNRISELENTVDFLDNEDFLAALFE